MSIVSKIATLFALALTPLPAFAAPFETTVPNPLPFTSIPQFLCQAAYALFWVALPVSVIAILIAAILYLTSAGNPQRINRAKDALLFSIVGWAAVLMSGAAGMLIARLLGATTTNFGKC